MSRLLGEGQGHRKKKSISVHPVRRWPVFSCKAILLLFLIMCSDSRIHDSHKSNVVCQKYFFGHLTWKCAYFFRPSVFAVIGIW